MIADGTQEKVDSLVTRTEDYPDVEHYHVIGGEGSQATAACCSFIKSIADSLSDGWLSESDNVWRHKGWLSRSSIYSMLRKEGKWNKASQSNLDSWVVCYAISHPRKRPLSSRSFYFSIFATFLSPVPLQSPMLAFNFTIRLFWWSFGFARMPRRPSSGSSVHVHFPQRDTNWTHCSQPDSTRS